MKPEILRFLLLARVHLRDSPDEPRKHTGHADLQGIDRMLPDTEWFERAEFEALPRRVPPDLWGDAHR
jgi:hypothetical protein